MTIPQKIVGSLLCILNEQDLVLMRRKDVQLLLSFCPKGPVEEGLDPTFYFTNRYEEDVQIVDRLDKIRTALDENKGHAL